MNKPKQLKLRSVVADQTQIGVPVINTARGVVDADEKDLPHLMKRCDQTGYTHGGGQQKVGYWPRTRKMNTASHGPLILLPFFRTLHPSAITADTLILRQSRRTLAIEAP